MRRLRMPGEVAGVIQGLHPEIKRKALSELDEVRVEPEIGKRSNAASALRATLISPRSNAVEDCLHVHTTIRVNRLLGIRALEQILKDVPEKQRDRREQFQRSSDVPIFGEVAQYGRCVE
jgi:hypothetical protein